MASETSETTASRAVKGSATRARIMKVLRKARDVFPITPLGLLLLGTAGVATWYFGFTKMDLVVLAMGAAALGVGLVAFIAVIATSIVLYRALRRIRASDPLRLECGAPIRTGFSASALWFVPLIEVKWTWPNPRAKAELARWRGRLWETVTPARRGTYDSIVRRVEVSDAFHMMKIVFELREERAVRALPATGGLRQMRVIRSLASGDDMHDPLGAAQGDRLDLRTYVPGDPVRYILWRVFAKSRQVVVRTPERAVSFAKKAYAYVVADESDEPAAGAARVAIESGAIGQDWLFGADGVAENADTKTRALQVLCDSARCPPERRGADLMPFLQRHVAIGRVLVFVPGKPGPWLDRVAAAAAPRRGALGAQVEFVVCVDQIVPGAKKKGWAGRLAPAAKDEADDETWVSVEADDLEEVVTKLGATRARVLLAERRGGRMYDASAIRTVARAQAAEVRA